MQSVFHRLSGTSPLFSFVLIIAAALPILFLLVYLSLVKTQPGYDYLQSRGLIHARLGVLALLGYVGIGIYSLQAPQPAVQLTLHLGSIFGLGVGIIVCVMAKWWGKYLFWSLLPAIAFPGITLSRLSQFLKGWFVALRTGRDRERVAPLLWPDIQWSVILRGSCTLILLISGGWACLIALQTGSSAIGWWSTAMGALVSVLTCLYFTVSISAHDCFKGERPFSSFQDVIELVSQLCLLLLVPLLPVIILALIGGFIGSILIGG